MNAHQNRFYNNELPLLLEVRCSSFNPATILQTFTVFEPFQTLDGEMYDKVKLYFSTLARSELECCGLTQECFAKILNDSILVRDNVLRS